MHCKSWPPGVIYQHKICNVKLSVNGLLKYNDLTPQWWWWRWFTEQIVCRHRELASQQQCINVFIMILCIVLHSTVGAWNQNDFRKKKEKGNRYCGRQFTHPITKYLECMRVKAKCSIHIFRNTPNIRRELLDGYFKHSNTSQSLLFENVKCFFSMLSSGLFVGPGLAR